MGNIQLQPSDYVKFVLQSDVSPTLTLLNEPEGWEEDELEIVRNKDYHGIFTQFTNGLRFRGVAKDYIEFAYRINGINSKLYLLKYELIKSEDTNPLNEQEKIDFQLSYIGLADFKTMKVEDNVLQVNFNSNELEELIKSHKSDDFNFDSNETIDGDYIPAISKNITTLKGRSIVANGVSDVQSGNPFGGWHINDSRYGTVPTEIISQGPSRHSSVDVFAWAFGDNPTTDGSIPNHCFFVDTVNEGESINLKVNVDCRFRYFAVDASDAMSVELRHYKFNGSGYDYISGDTITMFSASDDSGWHEFTYDAEITGVETSDCYIVMFKKTVDSGDFYVFAERHKITVNSVEYFEPSTNVAFQFIDRVGEYFMRKLTGENRFYSKLFGRTERGFAENGEFGHVGIIHGIQARKFTPFYEAYKPPTMSLDNFIKSLQAEFNVGIAIEKTNSGQRLRIESKRYFYQPTVAVKLETPIEKIKREVDEQSFFSGIEIGYDKGGDYENEIGLDEPNTKSKYVTPLRTTDKKYTKISSIRGDEYGLELCRRKPVDVYPTEDTEWDDDFWYLDLKPSENSNYYEQKDWQDSLAQVPSGIFEPDTFRSWLFTPARMLLRHGWVIRIGLEHANFMNKDIQFISAKANSNLETQLIGESNPLAENSNITVSRLQRSPVLPEIIKFEHPVSQDLMKQIQGTTRLLINGSYEDVPNWYFKFQWTNEVGELETGYLLSLKPKNTGQFEFIKANENIVY